MNFSHSKVSIRILIAIFFSVLLLAFLHNLWIPRGYYVSFDYLTQKPVDFRVYYASGRDGWSLSNRKCKQVGIGKGHLNIFIPSKKIDKLRIEFGNKPGNVELCNLCVDGEIKYDKIGLSAHDYRTSNVSKIDSIKDGIRVTATHTKSYVVLKSEVYFRAGKKREFNLLNFLLLLSAPFWLVYVLSDKSKEPAPVRNTLFNIEFLRILLTLGVVLFHLSGSCRFSSAGNYCVEMFFIISGYFLSISYKPNRSILSFALRYWIRFTPLVVVGGLLCMGGWQSLYGATMLMGTGLLKVSVPNGVAWYLGVLFWCSLLFMGVFKAVSEKRRIIFIAIISLVLLFPVARTDGDWYALIWGYYPRRLLRGVCCIGIGIILAHFFKRNKGSIQLNRKSIGISIVELALIVYFAISYVNKKYYLDDYTVYAATRI